MSKNFRQKGKISLSLLSVMIESLISEHHGKYSSDLSAGIDQVL